MLAAVPATPLSPRTPAINATIKNVTANPIMILLPTIKNLVVEIDNTVTSNDAKAMPTACTQRLRRKSGQERVIYAALLTILRK